MSVSVSLLALATLAVLAALPTQSVLWLSVASVCAIGLAWLALRIMWTEVLQSRREHAADRAATAYAYQSLFTKRAAEHAEFTTAMTERLAESHLTQRELQGLVVLTERRTVQAETRARRAGERLAEAQEQILELRAALRIRQAEESDALASWEGGAEPVIELVQRADMSGRARTSA
ncbi:MAG: hypothetical protein M3130_03780 [Actinomycetota bacterium]|nr:hypothetical protein [Actinomycetota bacterium]MDQ6934397.1 hypothetical protein [Actinomycetota bacterium]